ncbi:DUF2059 domain-containing protein [Seonamhaeicola algicola]|uniref:DUF2059 domain-containing protein n=1 Tax=Seonamhaeicola algicola TaxID=1719036 RepID=A0A5C7AXW9_9FLAO|nr:DUF2059 domain-containing protein [Seonamhaeicola algicola]TXE13017.1 DUF2059 domain-containing protein [Seonamhaeicola algicola]
MKKSIFICLFFLALSIHVNAQDTTTFKNETIEFIKLTGAGAAFENAISQIGVMVSDDKKADYTKEATATLGGLYEKLADLYMQEFTKEDIQELTAFYNTKLGKKLAEKQLGLTQKAMMVGQSWGMDLQAIAQKYN